MYIDDVIEINRPKPDTHFRLLPCKSCRSDNAAYVKYRSGSVELFRVSCFDCGYTVKPKQAACAHDAQLAWNGEGESV